MRVVILSYCGKQGKTTIGAQFIAPRIPGARYFAVETINETASSLGIEVERVSGEQFGKLARQLMREDAFVVDVGASNVEDFIAEMMKFEDSHEEFDYFVIPVKPGSVEAKETLKTIEALVGVGVPKEKIRVLFNAVHADVAEEFPAILGYARSTKSCTVNPQAFIPETDLFDTLAKRKMTMQALLDDPRDFRAELRALGKGADEKQAALLSDMHMMKSQAKPLKRHFDATFDALFK